MDVSQQIEQLTDQYLRGELSGNELMSFEQLIVDDATIGQYVQFQNDLVLGISHYRKVQLKSRLDAIEIGTGSVSGATLFQGFLKIAGTSLVAILIGLGVYNQIYDEPTVDQENQLEIENRDNYTFSESLEIPAIPIVKKKKPAVSVAVIKEEPLVSRKAETTLKEEEKSSSKTEENLIEYVPKVNVPALNDVSDSKEFVAQEISIPQVSGNDIVDRESEKPIDIKTFNRKINEIKYRYFDGKLYLYGDFKKEPYEILEINSRSARQIYLYYADKYYEIEMSDNVTILNPSTDDKLIEELKIIRNNKLN